MAGTMAQIFIQVKYTQKIHIQQYNDLEGLRRIERYA